MAATLTDALLPRRQAERKVTTDEIMRIIRDRRNGVRLSDFEHALVTEILSLRLKGKPFTTESVCAALDTLDKRLPSTVVCRPSVPKANNTAKIRPCDTALIMTPQIQN